MASKPTFDGRPGRGVWTMKYRPQPAGPWVKVVLGKHPEGWNPARPPRKPPREILDRHAEFAEIEYRARHNLGAPPPRARGLEGYVAEYLESHALANRPGSARQMRRHAARFLAFLAARGVATVQGVTRGHCRAYLDSRAAGGAAGTTLRTEKGYLSGIWGRAVEDGLMERNPWAGVEVPREEAPREPRFWSPEQVEAIAAACAKPWQGDLVRVLAWTGLRISCALAMDWSWADWPAGLVRVPPEHSKNGKPLRIPLTRAAHDVLAARLAAGSGSGLVFPHPRGKPGPVGYETARAAIERAILRAGVPPGVAHDLRHTYGRALVKMGVPFNVVQRALGHSTPALTARYSTADDETAAGTLRDLGPGPGAATPPPAADA